MPPGIHQYSLVVSTPQREMKFTAPTKDRHDIWLNVRSPTLSEDYSHILSLLFYLGVEVPSYTSKRSSCERARRFYERSAESHVHG